MANHKGEPVQDSVYWKWNELMDLSRFKNRVAFFNFDFLYLLTKINLSDLLYTIDLKIHNLVQNGGLHSPSSLIFTFRAKFLVYKRKKNLHIIQTFIRILMLKFVVYKSFIFIFHGFWQKKNFSGLLYAERLKCRIWQRMVAKVIWFLHFGLKVQSTLGKNNLHTNFSLCNY